MIPAELTTPEAAAAVGAAFAASLVEVVEAFTIVLAVAMLAGWRPALLGTAAALATLGAAVLALGPLIGRVPEAALQFAIGVLLLLFGLGWLRKAALRAGGVIPLHDETALYAGETERLGAELRMSPTAAAWIAGLAAFKAVLLEGLEVAFIVLAVGAGRGLTWAAGLGALAACLAVLAVGAALHRPLARVPENALKFGVGVMTCAFGVFWTGEAMGVDWPGHDLALFPLAALFLLAGLVAARTARRLAATA
ncbi:MAG: hypothetical protein VYD87_07200 [Pseudomonadota bacterium]|nr:hypothetical protein [Pseudomonadota bacterium]